MSNRDKAIKLLVIVPPSDPERARQAEQDDPRDETFSDMTFSDHVNAILQPDRIHGQPCWRLFADEDVYPRFSGDEVFGGDVGDAVSAALKLLDSATT